VRGDGPHGYDYDFHIADMGLGERLVAKGRYLNVLSESKCAAHAVNDSPGLIRMPHKLL
jgi:hypothetical protein